MFWSPYLWKDPFIKRENITSLPDELLMFFGVGSRGVWDEGIVLQGDFNQTGNKEGKVIPLKN